MKRWLLPMLTGLMLLAGCREIAQQTMAASAPASLKTAYTITVGVPKDAVEVPGETGKCYRHEGGEYEISTGVFAAADVQTAVAQVAGTQKQNMRIEQLQRFGLPEYRVSWQDRAQGMEHQADLVLDQGFCYAVVFSVQEQSAKRYGMLATELFSTFGLHFDEGV